MNYWDNYWKQTANPWVSAAVLTGGMVSALILFVLVRIDNKLDTLVGDSVQTPPIHRSVKP